MQIVQLSGLSWPAVRTALTLFEQGGWNGLKPEAVKAWLEESKAKIEVFYLPSYSPPN